MRAELIDDRRLEQLRELDQIADPGLRASGAIGHEDGVFGGDQQPRQLGHGAGIALRRRHHRQLRDPQHDAVRNRPLLKFGVGHDDDGTIGRRHRHFVGAHARLGVVLQRDRHVVPLDVVANHRGRILDAVLPLRARDARHGIERVAENDIDRNPVAVRVVEGHGRVLQADRAVGHHQQRLAFDLEVPVRHRHRRFFVAAGEELRLRIVGVVDDRLLQTAEARPGVGADIFEAERLDDVDHEIGATASLRQLLGVRLAGALRDSR